ncbi:fimbrial protein [Klebsiella aerogenes]|nr:fimbria/pilus chaperone family protein [Klebsiella aerogenes]RNT36783.1 fimbrial protein [Klebsiella aerogenes]HDS4947737.1 fimbria/pilus periplasmic chaperone [Klebsiella aerogenes]
MKRSLFRMLALTAVMTPLFCQASGILPSSSVVVVEEETGEATMTVRNTDSKPLLLVTTLKEVDGDRGNILQVSPPAVRVEGGKNQTVRFFLTNKTPLKTEHLRRVIFEGVSPKNKGQNVVQVNISQNLPVVIRPAGLARDNAPWKRLSWSFRNGALTVVNKSPYVVRLSQSVQSLPDNRNWEMGQSYILPSQTLTLKADGKDRPTAPEKVRLSPATTWGFSVDTFEAPVIR